MLATFGFSPMTPGANWTPRELNETKEQIAAYVSDNRWVADCPRCRSGVACWPDNPRACCYGCFTVYAVKFPPKRELANAIELLEQRPPGNRHWHPHLGEKASTLAQENAEHEAEIEDHRKIVSLVEPGALEVVYEEARRR